MTTEELVAAGDRLADLVEEIPGLEWQIAGEFNCSDRDDEKTREACRRAMEAVAAWREVRA